MSEPLISICKKKRAFAKRQNAIFPQKKQFAHKLLEVVLLIQKVDTYFNMKFEDYSFTILLPKFVLG